MRLLFTFIGGRGHFEPLVPVARAAAAAGHEVAFGCAPSKAPLVTAAGFRVFTLGSSADAAPEDRLVEPGPLRPPDVGREEREFRERFARRGAARRLPLTLALFDAWRPAVLVSDETDFGSLLAAERFNIPYATVLVIAAGLLPRPAVVGSTLDALRAEQGLAPDPTLNWISRYLVLSPFPPTLRHPTQPLPPTAHFFRLPDSGVGAGARPDWAAALPGAPTAYFTLGTVFNRESGDLFNRVLDGLGLLPVNSLVTVGRHLDPAALGPLPAHIRLTHYLPQAQILPHCDLVISHGGSGSLLGALAHGLPLVVLPLGADQLHNAGRCRALGLGQVLDAQTVTPAQIGAAVSATLADESYRRAARRLAVEIAALPDPDHAVWLLEQLAGKRRPIAAA